MGKSIHKYRSPMSSTKLACNWVGVYGGFNHSEWSETKPTTLNLSEAKHLISFTVMNRGLFRASLDTLDYIKAIQFHISFVVTLARNSILSRKLYIHIHVYSVYLHFRMRIFDVQLKSQDENLFCYQRIDTLDKVPVLN